MVWPACNWYTTHQQRAVLVHAVLGAVLVYAVLGAVLVQHSAVQYSHCRCNDCIDSAEQSSEDLCYEITADACLVKQ